MKILFFGDSITDMGRNRGDLPEIFRLGSGYVFLINGYLAAKYPKKYDIINRGISGNTSVDLYARIKTDVWNVKPDVLSILIGTNDIWHEMDETRRAGVDIKRYEKVYSAIIEETKERLTDTKIVLCEPFVLKGTSTTERFKEWEVIKDYAKVVKRLCDKYNLTFVPIQKEMDEQAEKFGEGYILYDGVHPNIGGANIIAKQWLNVVLKEKYL